MNNKKIVDNRWILALILIIPFMLRFFISRNLGNTFQSDDFFDEALLMNYADLGNHFSAQNTWSLVKSMGYSLFLCFVKATPFNYTTIMNLL